MGYNVKVVLLIQFIFILCVCVCGQVEDKLFFFFLINLSLPCAHRNISRPTFQIRDCRALYNDVRGSMAFSSGILNAHSVDDDDDDERDPLEIYVLEIGRRTKRTQRGFACTRHNTYSYVLHTIRVLNRRFRDNTRVRRLVRIDRLLRSSATSLCYAGPAFKRRYNDDGNPFEISNLLRNANKLHLTFRLGPSTPPGRSESSRSFENYAREF